MAKLYFRYGAMGCSKTANALMVNYNYEEKHLKPLLLAPKIILGKEKVLSSRAGLKHSCEYVEDYIICSTDNYETEIVDMNDKQKVFSKVRGYNCIIIDEVQFCSIAQIKMLKSIVNELQIPVICYGLKTDFMNIPFSTAEALLSRANVIEELKTVCWCGDGATCNTRLDEYGNVVKHGERIVINNEKSKYHYTSLCLKHYNAEDIGSYMREEFQNLHMINK